MSRWSRGEADIEQMLKSGELQSITGEAANGGPWLAKAESTAATATRIIDSDPTSAYTLAYDAARFACVGLLVQQGLRPTTAGGHYVVQQAMKSQFGPRFAVFGVMRRRRNELEYPEFPDETVEEDEAVQVLAAVKDLIQSSRQLLDHLGLF